MKLAGDLFFSMVHDWLWDYLPHKSRTKRTPVAYADGMKIFRRYVCDEMHLSMRTFKFSDCTFDFLLDYRNWLLDTRKLRPSTVNHRLTVVRSYFAYAASRMPSLMQSYLCVSEIPTVSEPKEVRELIESTDDLKALLDAPSHATRFGRRDKVIVGLLYDTAVRVEELVGISFGDVHAGAESPGIFIRGKGSKERTVPISKNMLPLVKEYINEFHPAPANEECPFFYVLLKGRKERMTTRNVERIVAKYGKAAGKTHPGIPEKVYPHMLRRTRATLWYREKVPIETIAVLLGHERIETTKDYYAKPSMEMKREASEKTMAQYDTEEQEWPDDEEALAREIGIL